MKNYTTTIICSILIAVLMFGGCLALFAGFDELTEDIYYAKAQVVEVNGSVVVAQTADGNLWEFESERDYFVNETIKICFNTNNTESIYDDMVMAVRGA